LGENIELVSELAGDLGLVKIDPAQAQQTILNLVLNARDAMPDGGRVTLSIRNCDGRYRDVTGVTNFAIGSRLRLATRVAA
jgi:signal transduction histidine kinase